VARDAKQKFPVTRHAPRGTPCRRGGGFVSADGDFERAYIGDWSGLSIERTGMDMKNPVVGVWGNALLLLLGILRRHCFRSPAGGTRTRWPRCRISFPGR